MGIFSQRSSLARENLDALKEGTSMEFNLERWAKRPQVMSVGVEKIE